MFTIIKTVSGVWYHLFNNGATKVHLSDFDVIIDAIAETYVIEAKNGSNIPSKAISISDIRVIDDSVSTTIPIAFSGATGLIELLTSLGYPPYLSNAPSQPPVKVYTKGQTAFFTNITQAWIDANFDNTGLGILEAIGWEKVPQLDGKVPIGQTTGGLFDNIGNSYGFANTVLVAHEADSAVFSDGKKGVNTLGTGATVSGYVLVEDPVTAKTVKTSKVGQDHTGAPSTVETGANKNYQPSLIVLYVRRTEDLWITGGSGMAQNLSQTLAIDNKTNEIPIVSNNGKAAVYVNDDYISLSYGPQSFAMTDTDVQLYSEVPVAFDSTVSTDFNTPVLNHNGAKVATQDWVASQGYGTVTPSTLISTDADNALVLGTDSKLFVPESGGGGNLPYQELIFTAVQTAPQTGITSGTLIEGGRYTIFDNGTADFTISGAPNNDIGTVFVANSTPPDWGDFGTLDFEGNPIVTILNNPLSDTYSSHYTAAGCYYLEGLLDFPTNTFPKLNILVDVIQQSVEDFTGIGQKQYLWYKNSLNVKQIILRSGASGDPADDVLDGSQLFIVKIFNP